MKEAAERDTVLEGVLDEFAGLAAIPRPSGHEKAVSNYLKKRLTELGFTVVQDEYKNIIADKAATPGCEKAPLTILQGHMDMVCVAEDGYDYNPEIDPIKLQRGDTYLEAEGTSLGGDDGIGVSVAIYAMLHAKEHGPLRLIVTVDEECGMTGAINLDAKYLTDAAYLINCDSEDYDELTIGSAGSVDLTFRRPMKQVEPTGTRAWTIQVGGLLGGHSGAEIDKERGNAVRTLALILLALQERGTIELNLFTGGKAHNAIPDTALAEIVTDLPLADLQAVIDGQKQHFHDVYGDADPDLTVDLTPVEMPATVIQAGDTQRLLRLLTVLHTGIYAMSTAVPGLVATSANLGVVRMMKNHDAVVEFFPRSSSDEKIEEFCTLAAIVGQMTGFAPEIGTQSPGWKENKDSRLAQIMSDVFAKQNGRPMKVGAIHAGLECGWHFEKNPKLDMVSTGVTAIDIHSPQEKIVLATIRPQVELIEETLREIASLEA